MKRSYHTDIMIQYKLCILPQEVIKQIASSTIDNWKKRDINRYFGMDNINDYEKNLAMMKDFLSRKTLLNAAKALYYIYCVNVKLFEKVKGKKSIIRQSGVVIIKTIDQVKEVIGQAKALKAFGISHQQYHAWKRNKKCSISPANLCRKIYHNQLTTKEVDTIKEYLMKTRYSHWNITAVFYRMLRDKAAFIGRTTFYKFVNRLNLQRIKPEKKKYGEGIRTDSPKRILHMDVTIFRPLDHTRVYLYFLVDNYSRFILNWKASLAYSAGITFENISEA
jgi:putative transposase